MDRSNANEMARSAITPSDLHSVASARASYNDEADPIAAALAADRSVRDASSGVARDHATTGAGQDNFKCVNHFPRGHPATARFARGLPPGYRGYQPRHEQLLDTDVLAFKVGAVIAPPVRYSPDRGAPRLHTARRAAERYSPGGLHHRRDLAVRV